MSVHGTKGLRVADASAMPYVTNGNIYAPVMMLAERASDLILGKAPLAAQHTEFYRHGISPLERKDAGIAPTPAARA
jgi:choline dehydrogenase